MVKISITKDIFVLNGVFSISRGAKQSAEVLTVCLEKDGVKGYGECVPYKYFNETMDSVSQDIVALNGLDFNYESLEQLAIKGAGKNAVSCAYLDWWAKSSKQRVWDLLNMPCPTNILTAYTISLSTAEQMATDALKHIDKPLLKLKLGGAGDIARISAVRQVRPDARIIVDANESWCEDSVEILLNACAMLGVEMVEQPLRADFDGILATIKRSVTVVADESFMRSCDIESLKHKYDGMNIKLDKSGGLYDALKSIKIAKANNLKVMIGCMMGTSLAMSPAMILAPYGDWIDLDGSLWVAQDRKYPLQVKDGAYLQTPDSKLWG